MFPSSSDEPATYSLDLTDQWLLDRLLSSYASMTPWSGDEEDLQMVDVRLTMFFTADRRTVLSLAREDHTLILVEQYKGSDLKDSFYMQPLLMYDFINELVIEPGGW